MKLKSDTGLSLVERLRAMGILEECEASCAEWGVTIAEAFPLGEKWSRSTPIVWARWEIFARLFARGWSAKAIGQALGCHHTTVTEGLRRTAGGGSRRKEEARPSRSSGGGEAAATPGKGQSTIDRPKGQGNFGGLP
jgi:hypothetical protein